MSPLLLAVVAALVIFLVYSYATSGPQTRRGTGLPPGPPGKPLIGNLDQIPPVHSWLKFKEWGDKYGPLFRLRLAGREHYIVSTEKVANDLLRERGNIYSSREQMPAAVQLLGGNLRPLFWPHNDTFRQGRKLMHSLTRDKMAESYQPTQVLESTRLLHDLIRQPSNYEGLFERYSSGLIFRLGFGKVMENHDDMTLKRLFKVVHVLERTASPGQYLVDTFPILMYLPDWLAPFKRELKQLHSEELDLFRSLLKDVEKEGEKAPRCWEKQYIEHKQEYGLSEDEGAYVVGYVNNPLSFLRARIDKARTLFEAGAGTTAAAMMSWILCMVLHPDEYSKLQDEIDSVVDDKRLPEFEDLPSLPRVRAIVKETLRWRPVTAGGLPHFSTADDVYEGMFIPAGTNIHPNQWAIHREPALYPDPEMFLPSRWLEPGYPTYREPLTQYPNITNYSSFGFGRRICPGQHIAERSLNLLVSRIAWACNITKKISDDGNELEVPLYDYVSGFNVQPKPFAFDLKARSEDRWKVVQREYESGQRSDPLKSR